MQLTATAIAAILAFAPAALSAAVSSTSFSSTSSLASSTSTTCASPITITTTTCDCQSTTPAPSPSISGGSSPTTSYNLNESTSACPVATNLPFCAMACIHAAAIDIGCAARPDMHHCQCENFSALSSVAGPCIFGACGPDLALQASSVGVEICSICEGVSA